MSINCVHVSGNLTRSPELRATQGGTEVLTFGIAVNDRRKNPQTGEWEDSPNFVDCVIFGKRADSLSKILYKGMKVAIEGKLRYQQWQDNNGQRRSKLSVVVDEIEFMSQSKAQNQVQQPQTNNYPPQQAQGQNSGVQLPQNTYYYQPQPPAQEVYDEDIPF